MTNIAASRLPAAASALARLRPWKDRLGAPSCTDLMPVFLSDVISAGGRRFMIRIVTQRPDGWYNAEIELS
ncbi:hypothetical protein [Pseudofrankia inefficax]|uniref:hypothetical protein n=1 Tax=Pseudofrankia inefficax (strain DSM 45817 / CECT 9037 / DDB 130130 / EuI1c) TaxID=298654 RepID=UPI00030A6ED8|nr:hypothetical protein [Pseudofrankia inefficax]